MTDKQSAIVIRFAVQDGQKVTEALKKLEADGTAAFRRIDAGTKDPLRGVALLQGATDELRSRMSAAAGQAGVFGSVLSGIGVKGLALAAALGVVTAGVRSLLSSAQQITLGAEAAGLTVERFQAIRAAVVDVGGDGNRAAAGLAQFAQQARSASFAQGELYEQLRLINPEFARQLATARSQAEALEVVAKAWDAAGSAQRRTALAQAAFGQGGTNTMLGLRRELAGGVSPDRIIDPELVRRADELAKRINAIADALSTRFVASLGPAVALLERFVKMLEEVDKQGSSPHTLPLRMNPLAGVASAWGDLARWATSGPSNRASDETSLFFEDVLRRREDLQRQLDRVNRQMARAEQDLQQSLARRGAPDLSPARAEVLDTVVQSNRERLEQLRAARRVVEEDLQDLKVQEENRRRGLPQVTVNPQSRPDSQNALVRDPRQIEISQLSVEQEALQRRVATMGEAATATDRLRLTTITLQLAQLQGVGISQKEAELVRNIARERIEAERVSMRTALGIATAEERLALKQRDLANLRQRNVIRTDEEAARALALYRKELEETVRQEQIRASNTPALTRIRVDAARPLRLDLDELGAKGIEEFNRGLFAMARNWKNAEQAAVDFGISVLEMFAQIALKRAILGPLARGFESLIGAIVPSADGNVLTAGGPLPLQRFALGGIGSPGGVARRPMVSLFGEGRLPEAYVPLPDGRTIPVTMDLRNAPPFGPGDPLPGRSPSAAPQVNISFAPPAGMEPEVQRTRNASGGEDVRIMFRRMVREVLAEELGEGGDVARLMARKRDNFR